MFEGNMTKQTAEWRQKMQDAEVQHAAECGLDSACQYVLHHAYGLVNKEIKEKDIAWNKCQNCGSPYRLDRGQGATVTHCCTPCEQAAIADLTASHLNW